jgi:hypothetical protein
MKTTAELLTEMTHTEDEASIIYEEAVTASIMSAESKENLLEKLLEKLNNKGLSIIDDKVVFLDKEGKIKVLMKRKESNSQ